APRSARALAARTVPRREPPSGVAEGLVLRQTAVECATYRVARAWGAWGSSGLRRGLLLGEEIGRETADALHHRGQTVAAAHAQVAIQTQPGEKALDVERHDVARFLAGIDALQQGDQAANDVGVAVGQELDHVGRPRPLAG